MSVYLRFLLYCVLIATGLVAAVVQLDRHALEYPFFAKFIPEPFADFSMVRKTAQEASLGDADYALAQARRLIFLHPVPAENLTIYAIAAFRKGEQNFGAKALTLSAQRGWREPFAQKAVAVASAQAGDWEIAADRLTALWKTRPTRSELGSISKQVLSYPQIQRNFAESLVAPAPWVHLFVTWGGQNLDPIAFSNIVDEANRRGAKFSCLSMSRIARRYLNRALRKAAEQIWSGSCAANSPRNNLDLTFSKIQSSKTSAFDPYSWDFPPAVGLSATLSGEGRSVGVNFRNDEPVRQVLANKFITLPPGNHKIHVSAKNLSARSRAVLIYFNCMGDETSTWQGPLVIEPRRSPISVQVPETGCEVQSIELRVAQGSGDQLRVWIN